MRFRPWAPVRAAVSREPAPHQMWRSSSSDCGSMRSGAWGAASDMYGCAAARVIGWPWMAWRNTSNFDIAMSAPRGSVEPV